MRSLLGALLLICFAGTAQAGECSPPEVIKNWMAMEWWDSVATTYTEPPDIDAISEGIQTASGRGMPQQIQIIVFRSADGAFVRVTVFQAVRDDLCYVGRIDVPAGMFDAWLSRSRS